MATSRTCRPCPDGTPVTAEFVIGACHQLFQIEKSFPMAKSDLQARPICHRTRDSMSGWPALGRCASVTLANARTYWCWPLPPSAIATVEEVPADLIQRASHQAPPPTPSSLSAQPAPPPRVP